jgi:hypothetical protein
MYRPLRHLADNFRNLLRLDAARGEPSRAVDVGWAIVPHGYGLKASVSVTQRVPKSPTNAS